MKRNFYQVLQIAQTATQKEIKLAFRRLAKKYHPDKNSGNTELEEEFKKINEAYHILSDENKRWAYDMALQLQQNPSLNTTTTAQTHTYRRYTRTRPRPYQSYNPPPKPPTIYSSKAYFQAGFFIVFLVVMVILGIKLLNSYSSYYYYQEALKDYKKGLYQSALSNLEFSINDFGNTSAEANLLAAKILVYNFNDHQEALNYLERSLENTQNDTTKAEVHYLTGLSLKNIGLFDEAYQNYKHSIIYNVNLDSSYYEMGEINTFIFQDYKQALDDFNSLIRINRLFSDAYLGKGICYQKLNEHNLAVINFEKFLTLNSTAGTAYYLKSISEIQLNNRNMACDDLIKASQMGIKEADDLMHSYCQ